MEAFTTNFDVLLTVPLSITTNFDVLLTVHLNIFILVINQLDAQILLL